MHEGERGREKERSETSFPAARRIVNVGAGDTRISSGNENPVGSICGVAPVMFHIDGTTSLFGCARG